MERNTCLQGKGMAGRGNYTRNMERKNCYKYTSSKHKNFAFADALKWDIIAFELGNSGLAPTGQLQESYRGGSNARSSAQMDGSKTCLTQ